MTRIIPQRCFLLLAFTGILLSQAQKPTLAVADTSGPTPTSDSGSSSADTVSPHSPGDTTPEVSPTELNDRPASTPDEKSDERLKKAAEHSVAPSNVEPVVITSETFTDDDHSHVVDGTTGKQSTDWSGTTSPAPHSSSSSGSDDPSTVPSSDPRSSDVGRDQVSTVQQTDAARTRSLNGDLATSPTVLVESDKPKSETVPPAELTTLEVAEMTTESESAASVNVSAAVHSSERLILASDATRTSPISSAALSSSSSEDSIHHPGSSAATAQASGASTVGERLAGTTPAEFPPELERESLYPDRSPEPLTVTFDPDGMTHNSSQDPDAVTFATRDDDGTSTGRTTRVFEILETHVGGGDREREPLSLAPHDGPDREELSSKNAIPGTTRQPGTIPGFVPLANDESEEMMNDSPQFGPIQSTTRNGKELEESVSNDISHTTGASSHHTTTHELGVSTDHQSEQSEFRPVTAPSPPESPKATATQASPPSPPETVSSTTTSPNGAANQSAESVTDAGNSSSSIAGVAVKTSVSVSLPLSKTMSDGDANSTVSDDAILPNISGILPFPIHLDGKDSTGVQTEAPSTVAPSSTTSGGLRIRKPRPKVGGGSEGSADSVPRTRKPFLSPPQRSSSTAGPPVSIFGKSRTRGASITSSTTARPWPQFSTMRVHYASRIPGAEIVFSMEPVPTTTPVTTTTETEEPFSFEPFTDATQGPVVPPNDDHITLVKVAGCVTVDRGLRWHEQLNNRHSPAYREKANYVQIQLERLFRTSPIASQVWKIQIDGFSGKRQSRSVVIDFFLYLIKSRNEISTEELTLVFHEKLLNNTFSRFTLDPSKTTFEFLNEEPMRPPTEAPESSEPEPVLPQWAIAVIVVGAASLIFIVLFAVVAILGRHHMRRRYSSKLNDEDSDWQTKMAAAYENLAADTIYEADDLHSSDTYKKKQHNATYHGRPSKPQRADSWSSSDWSPPPRRPRPQVHRIVY